MIMKNFSRKILKTHLDRAHKELNVLYEISCAMRTTLELDHILYIILTGVTSHLGLGYNRAFLFLVNPKKNCLECKMALGPDSGEDASKIWTYIEQSHQELYDLIQVEKFSSTTTKSSLYKAIKNVRFPLQSPETFLLTEAYQRGTAWHLSPNELKTYASDPLFKYFQTNDLLIMPLRAKNEINGIVVADNIYTQKPITENDIRIFSMLADQAALAIENSQLYELIVQKSHTDPVTNLWNHGFFQEKLTQELKTAEAKNTFLSLAMIDIDNFKQLNDNFGHQHGDVILRELARVFQDSSREMDYICRYGGEEFAIILGKTDEEQSVEVAERLRKRIAQHPFPGNQPDRPINITVSIGLATYPTHAQVTEDLISQADKAMYIAKFSGKNKTCVAAPNG